MARRAARGCEAPDESLTVEQPSFKPGDDGLLEAPALEAFRAKVRERGGELYRDLPWRNTRDPYQVLVSEVMLQQTQVPRVLDRWQRWVDEFPTVDALAAAPTSRVLEAWQGLGYNRRAVALKRACEECSARHAGQLPRDLAQLVALPGIGPATAAGVRAFAFGEPGVYLETNVRTVVLHECFSDQWDVDDKRVAPIVEQTCDAADPRGWYYAMLDYGAHLKKTLPNPSRRSRHHAVQSRFEGSHRQKRAEVLRALIAATSDGSRVSSAQVLARLNDVEVAAGRPEVDPAEVMAILGELSAEGMAAGSDKSGWSVA